MPEPRVFKGKASETGTKYCRARFVDRDGAVIVQADLTGTFTVKVYDLDSDDADLALYSNTAITVASVLTNTLQEWGLDSTGYNFESGITSNNVGGWEGGHTYRFCFFVTHTTEGVRSLVFEGLIEPLLGA